MRGNILKITATSIEAPGLEPVECDASALADLVDRELFDAVFCPEALRQWYDDLDGPLLLDLPPELQDTLWETMHDGTDYLALDRGVARVVDGDRAPNTQRKCDGPLRMLAALASPLLNEELDEDDRRQPQPIDLQARVGLFRRLAGTDAAAVIRVRRHVGWAELAAELAPGVDMLHLTAHGNVDVVALEKRDWTADEVNGDTLSSRVARSGAQFVVLECCLSAASDASGEPALAVKLVEAGVPAVVGMSGSVWGEGADIFTHHLYEHALQGIDVVEAVTLARMRMRDVCRQAGRMETRGHWAFPALYLHRRALQEALLHLPRLEGDHGVRLDGDVMPWPNPLLTPRRTFVGRRSFLVGLARALDPEATQPHKQQKVMITGHGGIGKTETALQAADRLRHRFRAGLVVMTGRARTPELDVMPAGGDLPPLTSAREFVLELAREFGLEPTGEETDRDLVRALAEVCNQRDVLVLLDNLEPFEEKTVRLLLGSLGGQCRVLATSRHELPGAEVHVRDLRHFSPLEAARCVVMEALSRGIDLPDDPGKIAEVCRYTPMPIRLAIGRIATHRQTEAQVIESFEQFTGPAEKIAEYAFGDTLKIATEDERLVFACASLYVQPPRRDALQAASGLEDDAFGKALSGAIRLSLLEPVGFGERLELPPLARPVAVQALRRRCDRYDAMRRGIAECAEFLQAMAESLHGGKVHDVMSALAEHVSQDEGAAPALVGEAQLLAVSELDREWLNAVGFACFAYDSSEWRAVAVFARRLSSYFGLRGMHLEAVRLGEMAVEAARLDGSREDAAVALNNLGLAYDGLSRYDDALAAEEEALALYREGGDRAGEGRALDNRGSIRAHQGDPASAIPDFEAALERHLEAEDYSSVVGSLVNMGGAHTLLGELGDALHCLEQALQLVGEVPNQVLETGVKSNLAALHIAGDRYEEALPLLEGVLKSKMQFGDRPGQGLALNNIGVCTSCLGDQEGALRVFAESLRIREEIGDRSGIAQTLSNMAICHELMGQYGEAESEYEKSLAIARDIGDRGAMGRVLLNMGVLAARRYDVESMLQHWRDALRLLSGSGLPEEAKLRRWLAELMQREPSSPEALADWVSEFLAREYSSSGPSGAAGDAPAEV